MRGDEPWRVNDVVAIVGTEDGTPAFLVEKRMEPRVDLLQDRSCLTSLPSLLCVRHHTEFTTYRLYVEYIGLKPHGAWS